MSDKPTPDIRNTYGEFLEQIDPEVLEAINSLPPLEWVNDTVKEDGTPHTARRFRIMFQESDT